MSHRRTQPTWRRRAAIAAGVLLAVGGATLAQAAVSGGTGTGAGPAALRAAASPHHIAAGAAAIPARPAATTAAPAATPKPAPPAPAVFTGLAFDTCTAPAPAKMTAWRAHSPYRGAAVYIGGRNRGCAQPQLTASWVRSVHAAGWRLIPLYVGAQPPCRKSGNPERITAATAASLGTADGDDAVKKAAALGMRPGSALYLDMEDYSIADAPCVKAVQTYVQAWDRAAHAHGYWAGFYGFGSSSAAAVAKAKPTVPDLPDALWYARYDGHADTTTGYPFAANLWTGHRRGHQYLVNRKESYGGVTLTIDRDAWDAPVAVVG